MKFLKNNWGTLVLIFIAALTLYITYQAFSGVASAGKSVVNFLTAPFTWIESLFVSSSPALPPPTTPNQTALALGQNPYPESDFGGLLSGQYDGDLNFDNN